MAAIKASSLSGAWGGGDVRMLDRIFLEQIIRQMRDMERKFILGYSPIRKLFLFFVEMDKLLRRCRQSLHPLFCSEAFTSPRGIKK